MGSKRVLIVEDDAIIAWHLERGLGDLGYHVVGVLDQGENALASVSYDRPDLAVMDIGLKGAMDGVETGRQMHDRFDVPVIFLTAFSDPGTLERAKSANPYGYLRKPFDDQTLRATIEMALHKHALETQLKESEQRYKLLFDAMQEGFALHEILLDAQGCPVDYRFLAVNPAFERLTGLKSAEILGKTVLEVLPDLEPGWIESYGRVALTGLPETFERFAGSLDKYYRVAVFSPRQGQFATLIADISQSKQLEHSLRDSEKRLRTLTAASTSFIMELDARGVIRFINKPFPGVAFDAMLDSSLFKWFPDSLRTRLQSTLDGVFHEGKLNALEFTVSNQYGELRSYIAQIIPVAGETGIEKAVMTATDITEQEHAELALAEERSLLARRVEERTADLSIANAQLARAARMKDEFLASMSHELRTPLTGILGLAEALQKDIYGELNERQMVALKNIEESGVHLLSLINDILDLSKIEAGRLELDIRPVSIPAVCNASVRLIHQAAARENISIDLTLDPAADLILADERRLKQILVNLLSNAVKFTPAGGRVGIGARLDPARGAVHFSVKDNGIGINKSEMERLFQPFVQLNSGLSRPYPGTGLGLSLVMKLVELHSGGISVESEPGHGSLFSVFLPWKPLGSEALESWMQLRGNIGHEESKKRQTVLVVENGLASADQLPRLLRERDCEVSVWKPGSDPLELAASLTPDVIFLDVLLPGLDGWDLLLRIKSDQILGIIPVVVVSALDERIRATAMGAADYMVRPITSEQLQATLKKIFAGREHKAQAYARVLPDLRGKQVLVVDDNDLALNTMMDFLSAQGCLAIPARNGTEAVELAHECRPDVILMDIQMPGMDGIESIRRIRANEDHEYTPIIAVTALAMVGDRERCLEAGADEYLSKPVGFDHLCEVMRAMLRRI